MADGTDARLARLGCRRVVFWAPAGLTLRQDPNHSLLRALYQAIREHPDLDPSVKRRLHGGRLKSFTLSPLFLRGADGIDRPVAALGGAPPWARLWVRWSALDAATLDAMERVLARTRADGAFSLDEQEIRVAGWSGLRPPGTRPIETYAELFAQAQPATEIVLRFTSPFAFRSGHDVVEPQNLAARHFFGGYLERWATFSPQEMAGLTAQHLLAAVRLLPPVDLHLNLRPLFPSMAPKRAYGGAVRFRVEGDALTRKRVAALADYAWYCGTGSGTAWGLGQTERV